MKKTKWIGGGVLLLLLIFAAAAGFYKWKEHHEAKPEISYTVTSKEHIADKDSGMKYVNNELLVTVKEGVKKEQIEKLAEKYHASVGGYIEVSGNSQWIFDENYTDEELEKIAKKIEKEEAVSSAVLNNVLEIQTQEAKPWLPYSPEWDNQKWDDNAPAGDNYYLEVIRADEAWKELSEIKNVENQAVNIGLIDTLFDADAKKEQYKKEDPDSRLYYTKEDNSYAGNPDLPFVKTFYNPSKSVTEAEVTDEEFKSHGSQVAAVMAATFDRQKKNSVGITGVYPYGDGHLYGASYQIEQMETGSISTYFQMIHFAQLLQEGVKVINCSYSIGDQNYFMTCMQDDDAGREKRKELVDGWGNEMGGFFKSYLKRGYDFLIVCSAGNDSDNSFQKDNYYTRKEEENGYQWERAEDSGYSGSIDEKCVSEFTCIPDPEVRSRIIVAGSCSYDMKQKNYSMSYFSNMGDTVDVLAPGENIKAKAYDGEYEKGFGTSLSAPLVAGTAAMMWTANPKLSAPEIKNILIEASESRNVTMAGRALGIYDANGANPTSEVPFLQIAERKYPILDAGEAVKRAKEFKGTTNKINVILAAVGDNESHAEICRSGSAHYQDKKEMYTNPTESMFIQAEIYDAKGNLVASCEKEKNWKVRLESGKYKIKVKAEGYKEIETKEFELEVVSEEKKEDTQKTDEEWQSKYVERADTEWVIGFLMEKSVTKHFEVIPREMSYTEADNLCKEMGGQLAQIRTAAENQEIFTRITQPLFNTPFGGNGCWLGAVSADDGSWKWNDGTDMVYENWCPGNPDGYENRAEAGGYQERYLEMVFNPEGLGYAVEPGEWNDTVERDESVGGFACEWDKSNVDLTLEQESFLKSIVYQARGKGSVDFQTDGVEFMSQYLLGPRIKIDMKVGEKGFEVPKNDMDQMMQQLFGVENGAEALAAKLQESSWNAGCSDGIFYSMTPSVGWLYTEEILFKRFIREDDYIRAEGIILNYDAEDGSHKLLSKDEFTLDIQVNENYKYCDGIRLLKYKDKFNEEAKQILPKDALNCDWQAHDGFALNGFCSLQPFTHQGKEYFLGVYMYGSKDSGNNDVHFVVIDKERKEIVDEAVWSDIRRGFFSYRKEPVTGNLWVVKRETETGTEFIGCYDSTFEEGLSQCVKTLQFDGKNLNSTWECKYAATLEGTVVYENGEQIYYGGMNGYEGDTMYQERMEAHQLNELMHAVSFDGAYDEENVICKLQAKDVWSGSEVIREEGTVTDYTNIEKNWSKYIKDL